MYEYNRFSIYFHNFTQFLFHSEYTERGHLFCVDDFSFSKTYLNQCQHIVAKIKHRDYTRAQKDILKS